MVQQVPEVISGTDLFPNRFLALASDRHDAERTGSLRAFSTASFMVRLEIGFKPRWLERNLIHQIKGDVLGKLNGHELGLLRIVLKKRNGQVAFQLFGSPTSIEKAKDLLGIC
jgi:hypothetical protein